MRGVHANNYSLIIVCVRRLALLMPRLLAHIYMHIYIMSINKITQILQRSVLECLDNPEPHTFKCIELWPHI